MSQEFDVIVVGARCSGSPLAALLARRGVKVALVEQASFPSDTLSTHIFQTQALTFLDRLGVIEKIRATGAPFLDRVDLRQEDLEFVTPIQLHSDDVGGTASVRRLLLDPILAQTAAEAGADLQMASKVTGLIEDRVEWPACGSHRTARRRRSGHGWLSAPTVATLRSRASSELASTTSRRTSDSSIGPSSRESSPTPIRHSCCTAGAIGW